MTSPTTDAEVVMARLESASSAADAMTSLQSIHVGLQTDWQPSWLWHHEELPEHLVHILQHAQLKTTQTSVDDECVALVLKIYQYLSTDKQCLMLPAPSQYLEALLDVMDRMSASTYTRVLALQRLEQVSKFTEAKEQWLQAPNGIHRLSDALTLALDNPLEEPVRTQALQVALLLAQSSPIAKVFLFAEVETKLLDATWQVYGGLTKGNPMVVDVLMFIKILLQQADPSLHELVWQRPAVGPRLAQLLDLRGGHEFLHPEEYIGKKEAKPSKEKPKLGPLSSRRRNDEEDDLDTLLQTKTLQKANDDDPKDMALPSYPQLLPAEETVVSHVLDIVGILLEKEDLRRTVWSTYAPGVCVFIWEMALMTPPPLGTTAFFALPSCRLQQQALELVASKLCDTVLMDRIHGLDRMLEVVCTGGGLAQSLSERLGCSQAALAVLRNALDATRIHEILLHTLAPPPTTDDDLPPPPTVVQKLWNTVAENLQDGKGDHKILFLSGALGGLSVFLAADAESREMLFQATPPLASIDHMLEVLLDAAPKELNPHERIVVWSLYRFLSEYIYETPRLVQTLLSSPVSTHLATLATTNNHTQPMAYLILGLSLEFFPSNAAECGGWTPTSILELLQTIGISKVTKALEGFKVTMKLENTVLTVCDPEAKHWQGWYETAVWTVRKRIVRELAGSSLDDEEDNSVAENNGTDIPKIKPLQRLIAQQTTELEDLRSQLQQATTKIASQEHQLETWQRRMRSNPTELDGMLNEFTTKTATLEENITSLQKMAKQSEERHEQQVSLLTKQLEEQRDEATKLRAVEKEAQDDRDRMSQELEALSQAYASLEEEYRRASSTVSETPQGPTTTEVSTLRAENTRLRQDAKAADDWMALAVQRMNEMGGHNGQLQQEVASLKEQLALTASKEEQNMRLEIDQLANERKGLLAKVSVLEVQIQQERNETLILREQLEKEQTQRAVEMAEWRQSQQKMEQEKMELALLVEQASTLSASAAEKNEVRSHGLSFDQEQASQIQEIQSELDSKTAENHSLQRALEEAQQSLSSAMASMQPPPSSNEISKQIETSIKEIEDIRHRSQEEIYKKESIIRELEDRLSSGLGSYKIDDIRERDQEIEELRAANEAAQEWMAKAVEHHHLLQEKVANLTEERATLVAQQQQAHLSSLHSNDAAVKLLESELKERTSELNFVQEQLMAKDAELTTLRLEFEASKSFQEGIGIAREDFQVVQKMFEEARAKTVELESKLEESADLETRLEEYQSWVDLAQTKIAELISAKEYADNLLREAREDIQSKEVEIETLQRAICPEKDQVVLTVAVESEADRSVIEQLRSEIEEWKSSNQDLAEERNIIKDDHTRLVSEVKELQAWTDGAQQRIFEVVLAKERLEAEVVDLKKQLASTLREPSLPVVESISDGTLNIVQESFMGIGDRGEDANVVIEKTTEALEQKNEELGSVPKTLACKEDTAMKWAERVAKLEAEIASLKSQALSQEDEAKATIGLWQQSHSDAEKRVAELENQVSILKDRASMVFDQHTKETSNLISSTSLAIVPDAPPIDAADFFGMTHQAPESTLSVSELTKQLDKKEKELQEAKEILERDEDVVRQWEERVAELEAEIDSLQTRTQEQEEEANAAISLWQEAHAEAEKRCNVLESKLVTRTQSLDHETAVHEDLVSTESSPHMDDTDLSCEIQRLRKELQAANDVLEADQDVVRQWEDRVAQLEATIDSLTIQITEEQIEANEVISRWQESFNEADRKCAELEEQLSDLQKNSVTLQIQDDVIARRNAQVKEEGKDVALLTDHLSKTSSLPPFLVDASNDASSFFGRQEAKQNEVTEGYLSGSVHEEKDTERWEEKVASLQLQVASLMRRVAEHERPNNSRISQEQLQMANEALATAEDSVNRWKVRSEELEDKMRNLVVRLEELQGESDETITNLQDKCDVLEERCSQLQDNNDNWWREKLLAEKRTEELEAKASLLEERAVELEGRLQATVEELSFTNSQLCYAMNDKHVLEEKLSLLEENLATFHARSSETLGDVLEAKEAELADLKQTLSQDEAVVKQWEERVKELESDLKELQDQLLQQEADATIAIDQWQETCSELEEKCSELEGKLASAVEDVGKNVQKLADRDWTIEQLQAVVDSYQDQVNVANNASEQRDRLEDELAVERGRHREAREEVDTLTQLLEETRIEFSDFRTESETVVAQWTERVDELEGRVSELDAQLSQQEAEANQAITSWEEKAQELESELDLATQTLTKAKACSEGRNIEAQKLEDQVAELMENVRKQEKINGILELERHEHSQKLHSFDEKLASLQTKYDELSDAESGTRSKLDGTVQELAMVKAERDRLKEIHASKSQEKLEEERDRLTIVIAQLEEELNEANNMVQAYITDGSSDKATQAAAQALRDEIDELKMQVEEHRLGAEEELYKREAAEHEIERLRDDIAALVSLNEHENLSDEIQQRTAKAVERLKMKERIEIDQLRKSLYRSIEETEAARAAEKQVNEQLSKLRLQTAIGEQEIIAAKSEILFLTQTMEELRMNEEGKRASMEYRINSLEDESDVLRRYHSSELESVRNELAQVSMEKDRVLHQLKESEKTSSALVFATAKAESIGTEDVDDLDAEVAKLRIENAHLLTVAADDKARAERRLREALAAHRATAEADTILEHELRLVAESTIQSLKAQLDEYRCMDRKEGTSRDDSNYVAVQAELEKLMDEVDGLRQELQKLQKENGILRTKMQQAANKSRSEIAALTDECRLAQAKAHKCEREGRFDAAVKSEMAKFRLSPEKRGPHSTFGNEEEDPALERVDPPLVGADAFDLIRKQKEEIQEERKMYLEFLAEHDDLLALLAQNDIERECLKEALSRTAGADAVEEVLRKVEAKTFEQFGNIIKVS